jgi:hypothetical protein
VTEIGIAGRVELKPTNEVATVAGRLVPTF